MSKMDTHMMAVDAGFTCTSTGLLIRSPPHPSLWGKIYGMLFILCGYCLSVFWVAVIDRLGDTVGSYGQQSRRKVGCWVGKEDRLKYLGIYPSLPLTTVDIQKVMLLFVSLLSLKSHATSLLRNSKMKPCGIGNSGKYWSQWKQIEKRTIQHILLLVSSVSIQALFIIFKFQV